MMGISFKKKQTHMVQQPKKLISFQQLAEMMDELVVICNESFDITYLNPAAVDFFKIGVGKNITFLSKDLDKIIKKAGQKPINEMIKISRDEDAREFSLTVQVLEEQMLLLFKDLEEVNQIKSEMEQVKITAEDTIKAKSMFLANMSHELRTPLNAIIGLSELLTDTSLEPSQKDLIHNINQSANILYDIINTILDFSKLEANQMGLEMISMDIREILSDLYTLFSHEAATKKIDLIFDVDEHIPPVTGDPVRLRQILVNLIGNAIKFTHIGNVTVTVKAKSFTSKSVVTEFVIQDTGIGFNEEAKQKIFLPFVQEDESKTRQYGGTGLGLPICKSLVDLHGGTMEASSAIGKGARFCVTIPYSLAPASQHNDFHEDTKQSIAHAKVLVAEDNLTNQKLLSMQLKNLNYDVSVVDNGQQAVEEYFENDYDVIIMDCQMPVMDGFCATLIIRQQEELFDRHVPIIALTASALKEDKEKCLECGMDDFITKPVKIETLNKTIQHWLYSNNTPKE